MKRVLTWIGSSMLFLVGLLGVTVYMGALLTTSDRVDLAAEYGAIFAFSTVATLAGVLLLAGLAGGLPTSIGTPGEWIAIVIFLLPVGGGIAANQLGVFVSLGPILAVLAAAGLFLLFTRLVVRWSPRQHVTSRGYVLPAIWGMVGATLSAGFMQILAVIVLVGAGAAGLALVDANLLDGIENWLNEIAETADFSILETPTVAFAAIGVLGITAPLTEELTKFLGVYIVFRRRTVSRYMLFAAGAAAGLGFAVVETLGYALMAPEQWPQIMLLRAPVALIHVAATTIVTLGWYKQRQSGGFWLILFYLLAVVVHAAWNTLFVSMMIVAAGMESAGSLAPAEALMTLVIVSAMGSVLLGCAIWIVANARRFGRESYASEVGTTYAPPTQATAQLTTY